LFENNKVEEAYKLILNRLDVNWDGALLEDEKRQARIELFWPQLGWSGRNFLAQKANNPRQSSVGV
jgi:hypothetical protein